MLKLLQAKIKEISGMAETKRVIPRRVDAKKFVRYKEGAKLYSMSQSKFEDIAKDAGAVYKLNKLVLVNTVIFEEYLETFRLMEG